MCMKIGRVCRGWVEIENAMKSAILNLNRGHLWQKMLTEIVNSRLSLENKQAQVMDRGHPRFHPSRKFI